MPDPIQNAQGVYQVPPIVVTPSAQRAQIKFGDLTDVEKQVLLSQTRTEVGNNVVGYDKLSDTEKSALAGAIREQSQRQGEAQAKTLGGAAEAQLGAPLKTYQQGGTEQIFTPQGPAPGVGYSEFDDPWLRFDAAHSTTVEQSVNKIKSKYPEMDVRTFDSPSGGKMIALRKPGDDGFTLLNSPSAITLGDVADTAGGLLNIQNVATAGAAFASAGAAYWARIGATALGGFAGRAADIAEENARNPGGLTLGQAFGSATTSGAVNALTEGTFNSLWRGGANLARGATPFNLSPEEKQAVSVLQSEGGEKMNIADVVPVFSRIRAQIMPLSKQAQMDYQQRLTDELGKLQTLADASSQHAGQWDDKTVLQAHQQAIGNLFNIAGFARPDPEVGGQAIKDGLREFRRAERNNLDTLYKRADGEGEGATFNVADVQSKAGDALKGILAAGQEGEAVNVAGGMPSEMRSALEDLSKINPQISAFGNNSAIQQIRALRSRFYDLKYSDVPGKEDRWNRMAGQIWDGLTQSMENPDNASPTYLASLKTANQANREFETTLDMASIKRASMTSDPGTLVHYIADPYKGTALGTFARVLPKQQWDAFKTAYQSDVASRSASAINAELDRWNVNPDAYKLLMSPEDQTEMRVFAQVKDRLSSSYDGAVRQAMVGLRAEKFVDSMSAEDLTQQIAQLGGAGSPEGKKLSAGVLTAIAQNSSQFNKGRWVLDPDKLVNQINKLDHDGKLDVLFDPGTAQALRNRRLVASLLNGGTDAGSSIAAAEVAGGVKHAVGLIFTGVKGIKALGHGLEGLYQAWAWAHILNSNMLRRVALGTGAQRSDFTTMRAISLIGAQLANESQEQSAEKNP